MFEAKRLDNDPNGVAPKASEIRKAAHSRDLTPVHKGVMPNGKPYPPARRTFRHRGDYFAGLDIRQRNREVLRWLKTTPDTDSAEESAFWTFDDTPADDRNLSPVEFALVRFLDTKAPGLSLDAFVNHFDCSEIDVIDPIAEISGLGDMEEISSFGEATPPCMRFYASIDEQAAQAVHLQ